MYRFTEKILTAGVVMNAESSQFNEEYMLAMKLLGDKAYCWKKNDHTYEVGRRVRDMPGQTGLGYDVWGTGPSWEVAFAQVRERHERENKPPPKARSKKMNTLKVKDPKHDGYVIYVHPRQGFSLELSFPGNPTEDDDWQVEIFSDYFAATSSGFKDGCKVYEFKQLYDLSAWAKVSSVQVAEVLIRWKGVKRPGYESRKVFVVLQGHRAEQRDILTIVNPVCTKVRISPHQLLEVVVFENDGVERQWADQIDFCIEQGKPYLEIEKIATRTVTHVLENGKYRDVNEDPYLINRNTFSVPINPKIEEDSPICPVRKAPPTMYRATHFFYRLAKHCIGEIQRLANGSYKASELVIHDGKETNADFALDVCVGVKGALKPKLRAFGLSKRQQLLTQENTLADGSNIGKKVLAKEHLYEKGRLLLNPDDHDNIEFVSGDENCLTVEIAPPHSFSPKCPKDAEWEVTADPVWQYRHRHEPQTRLTVMKLDKRLVLGVSIQRFMVTPAKGHDGHVGKHTFLGIVKFSVPGHKNMTRCVSFYMIEGSKPAKKGGGTRYSTYTPAPPPVPMRVIVKFHETRTNDLLVSGARTEKFEDIKIEDATTNSKGKKKKADDGIKISER